MAAAVLRGLVESEALVRRPKGWLFEPSAIPDLQSFQMDASLAKRRLDLLSGPTDALLSAGAILGKEFRLTEAAEVAQLDLHEAIAAVRRRPAAAPGLGPGRRGPVCLRPRHDSGQPSQPSFPSMQAMHLRRPILGRRSPQPISELAYHFDAAGRSDQSLPYALEAAKQPGASTRWKTRNSSTGLPSTVPATRSRRFAIGLPWGWATR